MIESERGVDLAAGLVGPAIFTDAAVYAAEQPRVFGHTWLYVGHESQLPQPGDYLSNYLGEVAVIVVRGADGRVRVLRNQCVHRGNRVCLYDRGHTRGFTCTFHGWQYDTEGQLVGVPYFEEAYHGELDRGAWGLAEAPRVASYGGLLFASWDAGIASLDAYLGDLRWYLDRLLVQEHLGGMEVVGGRQRYLMPANWKLLADNFHGDNYHVPTTHASFFKVTAQDASSYRGRATFNDRFQVAAGYRTGVSHGLGALELGDRPHLYERDLKAAEALGPEAVEWVHERYRRIEERLRDEPAKARGFSNCNIFPNLSFISFPSAFRAVGLIQWHPRGPMLSEAWQWGLVEKAAPAVVKQEALRNMMLGQAAAGMLAPDDTENFERSADNLLAQPAAERPFHYAMGLGHEEQTSLMQRLIEGGVDVAHLPGRIGPYNSELNQRDFYRCWAELMARPASAAAAASDGKRT